MVDARPGRPGGEVSENRQDNCITGSRNATQKAGDGTRNARQVPRSAATACLKHEAAAALPYG